MRFVVVVVVVAEAARAEICVHIALGDGCDGGGEGRRPLRERDRVKFMRSDSWVPLTWAALVVPHRCEHALPILPISFT